VQAPWRRARAVEDWGPHEVVLGRRLVQLNQAGLRLCRWNVLAQVTDESTARWGGRVAPAVLCARRNERAVRRRRAASKKHAFDAAVPRAPRLAREGGPPAAFCALSTAGSCRKRQVDTVERFGRRSDLPTKSIANHLPNLGDGDAMVPRGRRRRLLRDHCARACVCSRVLLLVPRGQVLRPSSEKSAVICSS